MKTTAFFVLCTMLSCKSSATRVRGEVDESVAFNLKLLSFILFEVFVFFTLSVPTESVQRALRMVAFLTQSVVDVFGVLWDFLS